MKRFPAQASRLGRPAYIDAPPRITASLIAKHGSYAAAREAVSQKEPQG